MMDFKAGLYDASGAGITGSSDLKIKIKRDADDYFYDFDDSTFKNAAWTTIAATMTEVDATNVPGEYEYTVDVSGWDDGVYTVYYQYSGSPAWTDAVEFRLYDGKESFEVADAILGDTGELQTNQGNWITATGFSTPSNVTDAQTAIIAEVDANETKIDAIQAALTALDNLIDRVLGLTQENHYLDTAVYDAYNNMTSCRIRIYSVAGSVGTDSNVLATYTVTCTYTDNLLSTFKVVKA